MTITLDKQQIRDKAEEITGTKWCATCFSHQDPKAAGATMVMKRAGRASFRQFRCAGCNARRAAHQAGCA